MSFSINDFLAVIREGGFKLTKQRKAILEAIITGTDKHQSSEEIYHFVKEEHPEIGLATVYRTLQIFLQADIVSTFTLGDGISRYEINKNMNRHRHHHLICTSCGSVIEPEGDLLDNIENEITEKYGFRITDHRLKFYGICRKCSNKKD